VTWIFSITGVCVTFWRNLKLLSSWKHNKPRGIIWYIIDTRNREQEWVKGQKGSIGTTKEKNGREKKKLRSVEMSDVLRLLSS
jgi:hypothetical protein